MFLEAVHEDINSRFQINFRRGEVDGNLEPNHIVPETFLCPLEAEEIYFISNGEAIGRFTCLIEIATA